MLLTSTLGLAEAGVYALLGYAVVFFGLILLMIVVMAMGKAFMAKDAKAADPSPAKAAAPAAVAVTEIPAALDPTNAAAPAATEVAPGTAGKLKLYDTPPKTAAMIMAIVADKMGKPLNELRFTSIKEDK